jgi:hypothetical protein
MQVSTGSSSYSALDLQKMLAALQAQQAQQTQTTQASQTTGQETPTEDTKKVGKGHHHHGGPPPGPPPTSASDQFSTDALSSLLDAQTSDPTASDVASKILSNLDTDKDGSLSLDEATKALESKSGKTQDLSSPFSKLDTNGDGKLTNQELTTALEAYQANQEQRTAKTPADEAMSASLAA